MRNPMSIKAADMIVKQRQLVMEYFRSSDSYNEQIFKLTLFKIF